MNKKLLLSVGAVIALCLCVTIFSGSDTKKETIASNNENSLQKDSQNLPHIKNEEAKAPAPAPKNISDFSKFIDMKKWQYNEKDGVYYQLGITYCKHPEDTTYEKLAIFVPSAYMDCKKNADNTYSCAKKIQSDEIGFYNSLSAPYLFPIHAPGYQANKALTKYIDVTPYTNAGMIVVYAGSRGLEHGAPYGVTDIKASIRYIRYNNQLLPGYKNRIVVFGMGSAGGLTAVLGTSGDSALYAPYLRKIGAIENQDGDMPNVVAVWCPITALDTANEAYEWDLGLSRIDMTEEQQKISSAMRKAYAQYINKAGFRHPQGQALTIQAGEKGDYMSGTYYDYVKETIEGSLNTFLRYTKFPYITHGYKNKKIFQDLTGEKTSGTDLTAATSELRTHTTEPLVLSGSYLTKDKYLAALNTPKKWIIYNYYAKSSEVKSVRSFVTKMKPATKAIGAFDALSRDQAENILFNTGDGKGVHFDTYTAKILENSKYGNDFKTDFKKQDALGYTVLQRADMYNPMYYILPSSMGYRTGKVAPVWRIRSGINQSDTSLTTDINLFLALNKYPSVKKIDFMPIWSLKHVEAEVSGDSQKNLIEWLNELMKPA